MATIGHPESARELISASSDDSISPGYAAYVPFGLIVAGFSAVTLWLAANINLYIDELYSLHTTSHGFGYAAEQALDFEQQPPLFFLTLTAWRAIDGSDYFARLFSIGCCLATLFVVWRFARRYFERLPDWLTPLSFALNPFFIWVALDIRVYAMIVLLSAVLVTLFFDVFCSDRASRVKLVAFTLTAVAAIYTQYFMGSILVGFGLALLLRGKRRKIVPFVGSMLVVALALAPLLLGSVNQEFKEATATHMVAPLLLAERMLSSTLSFLYPHTWVADFSKYLNIAYVGIVLGMLVLVLREKGRSAYVDMLAIVVASMVAFFLLVIIGLQAPLEMPRHITSLFVPTLLLALGSFATIKDRARRQRICITYLIVLLVFGAADDAKTYQFPLSNSGDWERVVEFLSPRVAASEPIVVFDTEGALAIRHYYRGAARVVPIPHEQSFKSFDRRDFALQSPQQVARVFPAPSPVTGRAWLVLGVSVCSMVETGASCAYLNSYLNAHYRVIAERRFNGTIVRELQAKPKDALGSSEPTWIEFQTFVIRRS
jgi:4-amino-4-deoxy-L-arabinose transferase-like glycosyltransferase